MLVFEIVVALLLAGAALTVLSQRIGTPYPALVALAGAALALVPGTPTIILDPELALTLFVAPVLLDSAFDASQRERLLSLRADGTIGDASFQRIEQELDVEELHVTQLVPDLKLDRER